MSYLEMIQCIQLVVILICDCAIIVSTAKFEIIFVYPYAWIIDYSCGVWRSWRDVVCLVLLQVPKYFVLVQIFWANPKIWLLQKLLCRHKKQFCWIQIIFLSGTKCLFGTVSKKIFGLAQKIGTSTKHFGTCKRTRH